MNFFDKPTLSVTFFVTDAGTDGFDVQVEEEGVAPEEQDVYVWPLAPGQKLEKEWIDLLTEVGETYGTDPADADTDDKDCPHDLNEWDRCPLNCDIDMPF